MEALREFLEETEEEQWVEALPPYQEEIVQTFLSEEDDPELAAQRWLTAGGPADTSPLGGQEGESVFLETLKEEIVALLCGAERYEEERQRLLAEFEAKHAYIVGSVSTIISPIVGASAPVIAPAVALILVTVGRVGLNAWCRTQLERDIS